MTTIVQRTTAEIYQEAADVNDQVTYGLRNALRIVDDTRDVQATTMAEVKKQGEQIGEIQASLEDVQEDNKYAQAVLDDIGCLCWCFGRKKSNKLQRPVHPPAYKPPGSKTATTKPNGNQKMARDDGKNKVGVNQTQQTTKDSSPDDPVLKRIEDGKKEQDTLLDQIANGVDVLAQGAKAMKEELAEQDKMIEMTEKKTDDVNQETKDTLRHPAFRRHIRNYM